MMKPFFKKEADSNNMTKYNELERELAKLDTEVARSRENILKHDKEIEELETDNKNMRKDKQFYADELKRLNTFNDPSGLTVE